MCTSFRANLRLLDMDLFTRVPGRKVAYQPESVTTLWPAFEFLPGPARFTLLTAAVPGVRSAPLIESIPLVVFRERDIIYFHWPIIKFQAVPANFKAMHKYGIYYPDLSAGPQ